MDFKLTVNEMDCGVPLISLGGEVDIYTAPKLKDEMKKYLEADIKRIVFDLSDVDYIDSTALGVFIGFLKRLRDRGGVLFLICPNMRLLRVFEITGLDKVFDIYNNSEEVSKLLNGACNG